jgi:hypothetical protein
MLVASCLLLGLATPTAQASRDQETVFDATNDLLLARSEAARDRILDDLQGLGVDIVRIVVPWRRIVPTPGSAARPLGFDPTDPAAYRGGELNSIDQAVRGAAARGMRVLLSPSAPIPDWASASGRSALVNPKPAEFRGLLVGLGRRYDGSFGSECLPVPSEDPPLPAGTLICLPGQRGPIPRVELWSMWNEPNLDLFLRPQYRRGRPVAGPIYRRLFLAGREGLRQSGHDADTVLIGETSPSSGYSSTAPLDFLAQVLCLDSRFRHRGGCPRLGATGWAHHPYDPRGSPFRASARRLLGIPALNRLQRALGTAARTGATEGRLPVYVTEYGVETVPDPDGVSLMRQAEYLGIGEYLLWRDRWVSSYGQYLLHDDRAGNRFAFQSGLRTRAGAAKPAYEAFAIPLVARRSGRRIRFWGHVRPGNGVREVLVETLGGGRVSELRRVNTDARGYFAFTARAGKARRWRAVCALADGRVLTGPFVRAYRF